MGKKSIENLQEPNANSLTPSQSVWTFELDLRQGPAEALLPKDQKQKTLRKLLHGSWRAGNRAKHLQEVCRRKHHVIQKINPIYGNICLI